MRRALMILSCVGLVYSASIFAEPASAQNPNYPGYLGVMVAEGNGGMQIRSFIPDTPAEQLAMDGNIVRNDTIVKLAGRPTRTLQELRAARNQIPYGKEAKMVLRSGNDYYHVWISRSEAVAAAAVYGSANPGSAAPRSAAPMQAQQQQRPDRFKKGGKGEGTEADIRDLKPDTAPPTGGDIRNK